MNAVKGQLCVNSCVQIHTARMESDTRVHVMMAILLIPMDTPVQVFWLMANK